MMKKRLALLITGLLVAAALTTATALSQASSAARVGDPPASEGLQLDGTWMVKVTRINPPPGVAPTFLSLITFVRGGGVVETSNTGTARRGPAEGQWERVGHALFATSMVFFRFDPVSGAYLGTQTVDRTMRLSDDGESFVAVSVSAQLDPAGNLVAGGLRATEVGERLAINRIPDQP